MTTVSLQFIRESRITSDLISWFSAGRLSHVDAVLPTGYLGAFQREVGGIPSGVFIRPNNYVKFAAQVRIDIPATDAQRHNWEAFLLGQIGKPYDWDVIAAFVAGSDWRDPNKWICSELQAAALQQAGIVPKLYLTANKITPVALALALSAVPGVTVTSIK
jgi:uncharacterized protein YycO